jgi:hypothetical protein
MTDKPDPKPPEPALPLTPDEYQAYLLANPRFKMATSKTAPAPDPDWIERRIAQLRANPRFKEMPRAGTGYTFMGEMINEMRKALKPKRASSAGQRTGDFSAKRNRRSSASANAAVRP